MRPKVGEVWIYTSITGTKIKEYITNIELAGYRYRNYNNSPCYTEWKTFDRLFKQGLLMPDKATIVQDDLKNLLK